LQELLKSRKTGAKPSIGDAGKGGAGAGGGKRYLILTYVVEFDRVHYPLPLQPLEAPTTASLQRQIRRLRREVATFRGLSGLQPTSAAALAPSGLPGASQAMLVREGSADAEETSRAGCSLRAAAAGCVQSRVSVRSRVTSLYLLLVACPPRVQVSSVSGLQREAALLRERVADLQASERSLTDALRDASTRLKAATDAAAAGDAALEKLRAASRAEVKRLRFEVAEQRDRCAGLEAAVVAAQSQAGGGPEGSYTGGGSDMATGRGSTGPGTQRRAEGEVLAVLRETNEVGERELGLASVRLSYAAVCVRPAPLSRSRSLSCCFF
jgi:hypothetical protein